MFKDLVKRNRSVRGFDNSRKVKKEELYDIVDAARFTASSVNLQPLKYVVVTDEENVAKVNSEVAFGRKLPEFNLPFPVTAPVAFIIICQDEDISKNENAFLKDVGIAAQTITLAAAEKDFGACMIGNFSPLKLSEKIELLENLRPMLVIALGKSIEEISIVEIENGESTDYYRDKEGKHYVPKRKLEDVIVELKQ